MYKERNKLFKEYIAETIAEAAREIHSNHDEVIVEVANRINRELGLTDDGDEVGGLKIHAASAAVQINYAYWKRTP